jgi:hypothetical protein
MKKIASISTNLKRNPIKARFLMGTMLSAVVLGSVHATPLDKALVVAQAPPQSEQEDKKQPPQRRRPSSAGSMAHCANLIYRNFHTWKTCIMQWGGPTTQFHFVGNNMEQML